MASLGLGAWVGCIGALACAQQPEAAQPTTSSTPLTRAELAACIELEDDLQARQTEHERQATEHRQESAAVDAESKALESSANALKSAGAAAHEAHNRRVDLFNERVSALNERSRRLNDDASQVRDLRQRFNLACANRPYQARDQELARRDVQERRAAAAAAGPFADGLKAFEEKRYQDALALWLPLAQKDRASSQFNVASMYEQGLGVDRDVAQAARWYLRAAELGSTAAQLKIAQLYERGLGVPQDFGSASYWYSEAAKAGGSERAADLARQARDGLSRLPKEYQAGAEQTVPFEGGRFILIRMQSKECILALQGTITRAADFKFGDALKLADSQGCVKPLMLMLESPGGDFEAGLSLGRSVRDEGMRTVARYECASSCAAIFLAGKERVLWGNRAAVGLHQIASVRGDRSEERSCVDQRDDRAVRMARSYMSVMVPDTADELTRIMMQTSCRSIEWLSGERALQLKVATKLEAEGRDVFGDKRERMESTSVVSPR